MKSKLFILTLLLALAPLRVLADSSPIMPEVADRLDAIERQTGSQAGYVRQVRAVYDASVSTKGATGAHGLGVYLPAKSTILRGWATITRRFDSSSGTIALSCEDAGNIMAATDLSIANYTDGTMIRLIPQDTLATVVKGTTIAAKCQVTATVSTTAHTTGKMVVWLEYFVSE